MGQGQGTAKRRNCPGKQHDNRHRTDGEASKIQSQVGRQGGAHDLPAALVLQINQARYQHQREEDIYRQVPGALGDDRVKGMDYENSQANGQNAPPGMPVADERITSVGAQHPEQDAHQYHEKQRVGQGLLVDQLTDNDVQAVGQHGQAFHPGQVIPAQDQAELPGNRYRAIGGSKKQADPQRKAALPKRQPGNQT